MDTSADEAIARALGAEYYGVADPDYAADAAYVDDSEDSDYFGGGPKKKKRRGPAGGGRGRGRGRPPGPGANAAVAAAAAGIPRYGAMDPTALGAFGAAGMGMGVDMVGGGGGGLSDGPEGDSDDDDDRTKTGRRRRKDVGKQRQAGRAWTAEEEALFLQAMETHGRDWKRGSELVGTRDHRAIASHAQKFFIKLCLAGKPLPHAVARTGLGYTLSGAMLDPYSAAARSYGFKPELLTRLSAEELHQALSGLDLDRLPQMYGGRLPNDQAPAPPPPRNASMGGFDDRGKKPGRGQGGKKRRKGAASSEGDDDMLGPDGTVGGVGVGGMMPAATVADPTNQAAAAAAVAAAMAAAVAAAGGGGGVGGIQAQLMAAAAAAAAQAQLAASTGSVGNLSSLVASAAAAAAQQQQQAAPVAAPAPAFGSFTALLSGATDGGAGPAVGAGSLAAALQGATAGAAAAAPTPLGSLSAALAAAPQAPLPPPSAVSAPAAPPLLGPPPAAATQQHHMGQTEYARNRPRRELAGQRAQMGVTSESLQLVKPQEFLGAQPYTVDMSSWALLAMDFHAHLSTYEVIGLLGGTWNPETRQLVVIEAYACRRAEGSGATTSVELDPAAQVEAQQLMEAKGQKCVGWYHSHPVFEPSPSQKDMDNQRNYQAFFRCEKTKTEPFLGIIVGPYDVAMPQPISLITTFMVRDFKGTMVPYSVRCQVHGYEVVPDGPLLSKLVAMLDTFREDPGRVDFGELWRGYSYIMADGSLEGDPLTRLAKFRHSLSTYMREADPAAVRGVLDLLCGELQNRWGVNVAAALAGPDGGAGSSGGGAGPLALAGQEAPPNGPEASGMQVGGSMLGLLLEDGDAGAAGAAPAAPPPPLAQPQALDAAAYGGAVLPAVGNGVGGMGGGGMLSALLADDDDNGVAASAAAPQPPGQQPPPQLDLQADASAAAVAAAAVAAAAATAGPGPGPVPSTGLLAAMAEAVQGSAGGFSEMLGTSVESGGVLMGQGQQDGQQQVAMAAGLYGQQVSMYGQSGGMYGQMVGGYEQTEGGTTEDVDEQGQQDGDGDMGPGEEGEEPGEEDEEDLGDEGEEEEDDVAGGG